MVRKVLKWIGLGLGGFIVLLVVMSLTGIAFPLGFLKSTVENAVKNATGRTLVLDGKFGVVPGFSPVARIGNVSLSNPEGFEEQTMATVESLSAEFHILPLLDSKIHVGKITISGVQADLEKNLSGLNNWTFAGPEKEETAEQQPTPETESESTSGGGFTLHALDGITLENIGLSYTDAASGAHQAVAINSLTVAAPESANIVMALAGEYRELALSLDVQGPSLANLTGKTFPITANLDAALSTLTLSAQASIDDSLAIASGIKIAGKELGDLGTALGVGLPAISDYGADVEVTVNGAQIEANNLVVVLDDNRIKGNLGVDLGGDVLGLSGNVDIENLDVASVAPDSEDSGDGEKEPEAGSESESEPADLSTLSELLRQYAVELDINIGQISAGGLTVHDSRIGIELLDGNLDTPLTINVNAIPMEGKLHLGSVGPGIEFSADLAVENNDVGDLEQWVKMDRVDGALGVFRVAVDTAGETVEDLGQNMKADIEIRDAELIYLDRDGGNPVEFTLASLSGHVAQKENTSLQANGSLLGEAFELSLTGGKMGQLLGGKEFPISLAFSGLAAELAVDGALKKATADDGSSLNINLNIANLGELHKWLGTDPETTTGLSLTGSMAGTTNGFVIPDLAVTIGESQINGQFSSDKSGEEPIYGIALSSPLVNVSELAGLFAEAEAEVSADSDGEEASESSESTIESTADAAGPEDRKSTLSMPILPGGINLPNADIDISLDTIRLEQLDITGVTFAGAMREGRLPPSPFTMSTVGTDFTGEIGFDSLRKPPQAIINVETQDVDLGQIVGDLGFAEDVQASAGLMALNIELNGGSLKQILNKSIIHAKMRDAKWVLTDPGSGKTLPLEISQSDLTIRPGEPIKLTQQATAKNQPVEITITAGRPESVEQRDQIALEIQLTYLDNVLVFSGSTPLPLKPNYAKLNLSMTGSDMGTFSPLVGMRVPEFGPYELTGEFQMDDKGYDLSELNIQVGESVLNGTANLNTSGPVPDFDVALVSDLVQINDFERKSVETEAEPAPEPEATEESPEQEPSAEESFERPSETEEEPRFTAENLGLANGRFNVKVKEIMSGEDWLGDGEVNITLQDSRLDFDPIQVNLPGGGFDFKLAMFPSEGDDVHMEVTANIDEFDYGVLARRVKPETKMSGLVYLAVDIKSQAKYADRLMAKANGYVDFVVLPEFFEAGIIDLWASSLLVAVLPKMGSNPSLVNCLIARFNIEDGIMTEEQLLLDTSKLRAEGEGEIDFNEEYIDYTLKPKAKNAGFFQVQAPVNIEGSFAEMQFGLEGGLIGTTLRMVATTYTVPIRIITGKRVPRDGSDVCIPLEPREAAEAEDQSQ